MTRNKDGRRRGNPLRAAFAQWSFAGTAAGIIFLRLWAAPDTRTHRSPFLASLADVSDPGGGCVSCPWQFINTAPFAALPTIECRDVRGIPFSSVPLVVPGHDCMMHEAAVKAHRGLTII